MKSLIIHHTNKNLLGVYFLVQLSNLIISFRFSHVKLAFSMQSSWLTRQTPCLPTHWFTTSNFRNAERHQIIILTRPTRLQTITSHKLTKAEISFRIRIHNLLILFKQQIFSMTTKSLPICYAWRVIQCTYLCDTFCFTQEKSIRYIFLLKCSLIHQIVEHFLRNS